MQQTLYQQIELQTDPYIQNNSALKSISRNIITYYDLSKVYYMFYNRMNLKYKPNRKIKGCPFLTFFVRKMKEIELNNRQYNKMYFNFKRLIEEDWVFHDYFVFSKTTEYF